MPEGSSVNALLLIKVIESHDPRRGSRFSHYLGEYKPVLRSEMFTYGWEAVTIFYEFLIFIDLPRRPVRKKIIATNPGVRLRKIRRVSGTDSRSVGPEELKERQGYPG
jgi:hypothetical protein